MESAYKSTFRLKTQPRAFHSYKERDSAGEEMWTREQVVGSQSL